jgi:hypothetical protein
VDFDIDFMRVALESAADHLKATRPERENAKVGELVVRLLSAGDLYIAEIEELGYLVVWTSESAAVKAHDRELVQALERADENVQLLSHT